MEWVMEVASQIKVCKRRERGVKRERAWDERRLNEKRQQLISYRLVLWITLHYSLWGYDDNREIRDSFSSKDRERQRGRESMMHWDASPTKQRGSSLYNLHTYSLKIQMQVKSQSNAREKWLFGNFLRNEWCKQFKSFTSSNIL